MKIRPLVSSGTICTPSFVQLTFGGGFPIGGAQRNTEVLPSEVSTEVLPTGPKLLRKSEKKKTDIKKDFIGQSADVRVENQTLKAFVAVSCLSAKFYCPVARENISVLATAHDCDTGLLMLATIKPATFNK